MSSSHPPVSRETVSNLVDDLLSADIVVVATDACGQVFETSPNIVTLEILTVSLLSQSQTL